MLVVVDVSSVDVPSVVELVAVDVVSVVEVDCAAELSAAIRLLSRSTALYVVVRLRLRLEMIADCDDSVTALLTMLLNSPLLVVDVSAWVTEVLLDVELVLVP
jgi:hypothetical protein